MTKADSTNKEISELSKFYNLYKKIKKILDLVPRKQMPPLTLDDQLENINPYYRKNGIVKYG